MSKYIKAIRMLAKMKALDAENTEKLLNAHVEERDGGPGSGNFNHSGRPGANGGSSPNGGASASGTSVPSMKEYRKQLANEPGRPKVAMGYVKGKTPELWKKTENPAPRKFTFRGKPLSPKTQDSINNFLNGTKEVVTEDGGPGSGNYGHAGRPGKIGGSGKTGTGGKASGNAGTAKNGTVYSGRDYTLKNRGLRTIKRVKNKEGKMVWNGPGRTWEEKGKKSKVLPNGSGTTRISEKDVAHGLHTINKHLTPDGRLSAERAALHEKIVQDLFKGKKPKGPGETKTLYFLGGGSASGKSSFTNPEKSKRYGMPSKKEVTVVDADELKKKLPEYDEESDTGTTDRVKAANFAHEESSALSKRAIEAAYANGYDVTLDGTGDSGADKVKKKIAEARSHGYRVEGRYCTASIENALIRNRERAIKEHRLVDDDSVVGIHKDVSSIFEEVAPEFDHVELWDHDGPEPVLVATCERGKKVDIKNQQLWDKFKAKAHWGEENA